MLEPLRPQARRRRCRFARPFLLDASAGARGPPGRPGRHPGRVRRRRRHQNVPEETRSAGNGGDLEPPRRQGVSDEQRLHPLMIFRGGSQEEDPPFLKNSAPPTQK